MSNNVIPKEVLLTLARAGVGQFTETRLLFLQPSEGRDQVEGNSSAVEPTAENVQAIGGTQQGKARRIKWIPR
jgi:hypothetical protein